MIKLNLKDRFFHPKYGYGIVVDIQVKQISKVKIETITLLTDMGETVKFHTSKDNKMVGIQLT